MNTRPLISKQYAGTRHLMNPQREYVKAAATDIRATFARIREEQVKATPIKNTSVIRLRGK